MTEPTDLDMVQGAALAAFALSVNTLRLLQQNGPINQHDVNSIVSGVLRSLEQSDVVSDVSAHSARELHSGVAEDLGVPMTKPI